MAGKEIRKENPDAWRTLFKLVTPSFKVRLFFEPRNIFIGIFMDLRETGVNYWICLIPLFTIQLVFKLNEDLRCKGCGYFHNGKTLPKWCVEVITLKSQNKHLRDFIEKPLIRKIFIEHAWREFDERKKQQEKR